MAEAKKGKPEKGSAPGPAGPGLARPAANVLLAELRSQAAELELQAVRILEVDGLAPTARPRLSMTNRGLSSSSGWAVIWRKLPVVGSFLSPKASPRAPSS